MAETVKSNKEFLMGYTSKLSSTISSASTSGLGGLGFSSSSNCPTQEPAIVESMLLCCKEAFRRIGKDVSNINSVADSIDALDNSMAGIATTLNMSVTSSAVDIGELISTDGKSSSFKNNDELREEIARIVGEKGGDLKLEDRSKGSGNNSGGFSSLPYFSTSDAPLQATTLSSTTPTSSTTPASSLTAPTSVFAPSKKVDDVVDDKEAQTDKPKVSTLAAVTTASSVSPSIIQASSSYPSSVTTSSSSTSSMSSKEDDILDDKLVNDTLIEDEVVINQSGIEILDNTLPENSPLRNTDIINIDEVEPETKIVAKANDNDPLVAGIAAVAATGALAGAGAYAANKILKEKEEDEKEEEEFYKGEGETA